MISPDICAFQWEKKCKLLNEAANNGSQRLLTGPVNDIHNELNSEIFYNCDRNTIHNLNSSFTNGVVPLQNHTLEEYQVSGIAEFDGHVHGANSCTSTSSGTQFGMNTRSINFYQLYICYTIYVIIKFSNMDFLISSGHLSYLVFIIRLHG